MKSIIKMVREQAQRHRSRKELLELSPHLLKDINVRPYDAAHEARKHFWQ